MSAQSDFGLWIDDPWRLVRKPEYWEALKAHGVQTADLMIDSMARSWDLQYSMERIKTFCDLAISWDVEAVVLGWPTPRKSVIDAMIADLKAICSFGIAAIGLDTEMTWQTDDLDGSFETLDHAAVYLLERLFELRDRFDIRIELTTHMGHREATERATLAPYVDRVYYQMYSTRIDWKGNKVPWKSRYGPGRRQVSDIARIRRRVLGVREGNVQLCVGQALYQQKWPGHTVGEALDLALASTVDAGITSIRGWSSKWIVGVKSKSRVQQDVSGWVKSNFGP